MENVSLKTILLVYAGHPGGTTDQLKLALEQGLQHDELVIEKRVLWAPNANADDVLWADGILLATPEHFGYMAGKMKDFFDRTFYPVENKTLGKPYALVVSAGNDGVGTVQAVERIVKGYGWKAIAPALRVIGKPTPPCLQKAAEMAQTLALGLQENIF